MAPILDVTFRVAFGSMAYGVLLILVYALGHCGVIILAGTSTTLVQRYLTWTARTRTSLILKRICGVLVLLAGLYMLYAA